MTDKQDRCLDRLADVIQRGDEKDIGEIARLLGAADTGLAPEDRYMDPRSQSSKGFTLENRHISGIDLIRFVTALMVMNFHLIFWAGTRGSSLLISGGAASFPELTYFTWFGGVGVQVFFVISGFVIAYSTRGKSPAQFLRSRFWRLFPTIWICAPISALFLTIIGINLGLPPLELLLRSVLLYPFAPWVDAVYWSLTVEVVFYSVVLLFLSVRPKADFFGYLAVALLAASLAYFAGRLFFGFPRVSPLFLLQDGHYFALGIVFWLIKENGWKPQYLALAAVAVLTAWLELDSIRRGRPPLLFWSWFSAWCVCSVAILAAALYPFRGNQFIRRLGLMTYPLYLLHNVVGCSLLRLTPEIGRLPALIVAITTSLLLALLVVRLEPFIRIGLKFAWTAIQPRKVVVGP